MNCTFVWRKRSARSVEDVPRAIYRGAPHQHQYHENSREVENSAVVTVSVGNFMMKEKKFVLEAAFDHFKRILFNHGKRTSTVMLISKQLIRPL